MRKIAIEGPNGIGKTTLINKLINRLEELGFDVWYRKLKPKNRSAEMHMNKSLALEKFSLKEANFEVPIGKGVGRPTCGTDVAVPAVKELVMNFIGMLEQMEEYDDMSKPDRIYIYDRSIISTYIYGMMFAYYLQGCEFIPWFRDTNFFSYVGESLLNRKFPIQDSIYKSMEEFNLRHKMNITYVMVPSNKSTDFFFKEGVLAREDKEPVIFDDYPIQKKVTSMYTELCLTKFKSHYKRQLAKLTPLSLLEVKDQWSNMDKCVDIIVDQTVSRYFECGSSGKLKPRTTRFIQRAYTDWLKDYR